jgi:uncharacterized protein with PhoU and TrkA domain
MHERGQWVFNPGDEHLVHPGVVLVLMANPDGLEQIQRRLAV